MLDNPFYVLGLLALCWPGPIPIVITIGLMVFARKYHITIKRVGDDNSAPPRPMET